MNILSKKTMNPKANIIDGKLILSLPGALKPVVWQMDFAHIKASALEVIEQDEQHALVLKTAKGEVTEIAPFYSKSDAVKALLSVSKALEKATGKIRPNTATSTKENTTSQKKKKWVAPLLAFIMLLVLLFLWSALSISPTTVSNTSSQNIQSQTDSIGVPMSADEFLRAQ